MDCPHTGTAPKITQLYSLSFDLDFHDANAAYFKVTLRWPNTLSITYLQDLRLQFKVDACNWKKDSVSLTSFCNKQAGAGLVADSVPQSEFEETTNKAAALGRAIDLAEQAFLEGKQ